MERSQTLSCISRLRHRVELFLQPNPQLFSRSRPPHLHNDIHGGQATTSGPEDLSDHALQCIALVRPPDRAFPNDETEPGARHCIRNRIDS